MRLRMTSLCAMMSQCGEASYKVRAPVDAPQRARRRASTAWAWAPARADMSARLSETPVSSTPNHYSFVVLLHTPDTQEEAAHAALVTGTLAQQVTAAVQDALAVACLENAEHERARHTSDAAVTPVKRAREHALLDELASADGSCDENRALVASSSTCTEDAASALFLTPAAAAPHMRRALSCDSVRTLSSRADESPHLDFHDGTLKVHTPEERKPRSAACPAWANTLQLSQYRDTVVRELDRFRKAHPTRRIQYRVISTISQVPPSFGH